MNIPYWLLRLLPMWEYICPKCRKGVKQNAHECPHCGERFPLAIRVPPSFLKDPKKLEEYVHKHVFPRISEFERNYLTKYFTTIFSDGFESGNFTAWTGVGGSPTVQSSVKHHGTYAMLADGELNERAYKTISGNTIYLRSYVQFDGLPASGNRLQLLNIYGPFADATTDITAGIKNWAGTYKWGITYANGATTESTYYAASPTPVINTWYCLELKMVVTVGVGYGWELFLNDVSIKSGTVTDAATVAVDTVAVMGKSTETINVYHDCVVVADAYIVPEGGTLQTVTDAVGLSDSVLRHKSLLPVSDVVGLAELILRHKTFAVSDSVGASDLARTNKSPLIVTDALSLVDAILRNKQFALVDTIALADLIDVIKGLILKTVTDSIGLSDAVLRDKVLALIDAVSLADAVSTPSRVLRALDQVGLADGALVNKVLQLTESISLVEVVEVGTGGAAKKTKLFLILGELALQLTGD